ncbi:MAG: hypothetical protein CM1200mP10_14730 [Candidatus Neomarinimicrobiota bacterium]|nr:MAG: hypothetical protein CM1200mP10_14730 [Candidatus Neomarinimicrobiota bacterium]
MKPLIMGGCNINSLELYAGNDYTLGIVTEGPGIGQKSEAVSVTNIYPKILNGHDQYRSNQ